MVWRGPGANETLLIHPSFQSPDGPCSFCSAWGNAGLVKCPLPGLRPPWVHPPCSQPLSGWATSRCRTRRQGWVTACEPHTSTSTHCQLPCWQLLQCPPPFPPADSWHHASVGLGFHRREGEHQTSGREARCLLEMRGREKLIAANL